MCGRYSFTASKERVESQFGIQIGHPLHTSYNIAPTHISGVITNEQPNRLQYMTWGLVPAWSNDGRNQGKLINARMEGISTKPSFRMPIRQRRCIVLADSFYEWRREGSQKIPYRIKYKEERLLEIAGIWDIWQHEGTTVKSFSIITIAPNLEMQEIHNRMPVIIDGASQRKEWLDNSTSLNAVMGLMQTLEDGKLEMYRVSEHLNSPKNNYPELQLEVPEPPTLF